MRGTSENRQAVIYSLVPSILLLAALLSAPPALARPRKPGLKAMIGQMIMVGFHGTKADEPWVRRLREQVDGGVVGAVTLYGRNIESREQVAALNGFLRGGKSAQPLLIAVSQEGGQVQRLNARNGFADFKSAKAVASNLSPLEAGVYYDEMAQAVSSAAFNLVLAPVVDLDSDAPSPVIGGRERSFSRDPGRVAAYGAAFIDAFHRRKILTCLKHFPGHGRAPGDTHLGWVDTTKTWTEDELRPFFDLTKTGKADIVMTAHIFNASIDPEHAATMSPAALGLLRQRGGFEGVIMTDALDMAAVQDRYGFEDAVVRTIAAGADLLLLPNNLEVKDTSGMKPGPDLPERVIAIIEKAVKEKRLSAERIDLSYRRILRLKASIRQGL